jgi:hypothetical protein
MSSGSLIIYKNANGILLHIFSLSTYSCGERKTGKKKSDFMLKETLAEIHQIRQNIFTRWKIKMQDFATHKGPQTWTFIEENQRWALPIEFRYSESDSYRTK